MGRSYSSGVAVDKSNFSPDVAVRVAPVPQDDAARSRSSSAHVHVSSQVDAHLAFGVLVRRAASALARCYCVGVAILLASAAATSAALSADSAALRTGFAFGSAVARQAASVPEALRRTATQVVQASRCVSRLQYGEFLGSVLPLLCRDYVWHETKPGLQRLRRLSGTRLGSDQSAWGRIRALSEAS